MYFFLCAIGFVCLIIIVMTVTNARWFVTMGRVEMTDSIKLRRRWSWRFRGGVPRGPFKAALIARENAPASTPGARVSLQFIRDCPVAPSSNSGWTFATVKINPCEDGTNVSTAAILLAQERPTRKFNVFRYLPFSFPEYLYSAPSPFHRIITAHSIRAPDRFSPMRFLWCFNRRPRA